MITEIIDQKIAEYFEAQSKPPMYLIIDYSNFSLLKKECSKTRLSFIGQAIFFDDLRVSIVPPIKVTTTDHFIEVAF